MHKLFTYMHELYKTKTSNIHTFIVCRKFNYFKRLYPQVGIIFSLKEFISIGATKQGTSKK